MGKRLGALLLAIPLSCAGALAAPHISGVSAGTKYSDRAALSGPMFLRGDSVVLESENLSLRIDELPASEGDSFSSTLTSDMVFYNPGAQDALVELAYPCPVCPANGTGAYRFECDGGETVSTVAMNSYVGYFRHTYDLEYGVKQILRTLGEPVPDDPVAFYRGDPDVKEYKFSVDLSEEALRGEGKVRPALVLTFDCDPSATRIFSCSTVSYEVVNGRMELSFELQQGQNSFDLAVAGRDIEHLGYAVYGDLAHSKKLPVSVFCAAYSETFSQYALSFRPEGGGMTDRDWTTGLAEMLAGSTVGCIAYGKPCNLRPDAFLEWRLYSVTVPAGGRTTSRVTAPLVPAVEEGKCRFDVLLSPLSGWGASAFSVSLQTPYTLSESNLEFAQSGQSYSFSRDRLPLGELSIALSRQDDTPSAPADGYDPVSPSLRLAFILLGVLGGLALIGGGIALILTKGRRKRK